ncbi:MOSC domain-containing protein [Haloechinothrix sp. LS1_15]|nr:MOSC domain-containing protein [Haloechinothrix sp. LS1_15]
MAELVCYPVKSCAGVPVASARVLPTGLEHDRRFVIVDAASGTFLSQRTYPAMACIQPEVIPCGPGVTGLTGLTLSAPGHEPVTVDVDPEGPRRAVTVHSWEGIGVDQGDSVAAWLGDVLGTPVRLVAAPADIRRHRAGRYGSWSHFADAYPVLVASQASLDELIARLGERGGEPVPMTRFRPNIVVSGWAAPHLEDRVDRLAIGGNGGAELGFERECVRCTIPLVDQDTGRKAGPEPIRTLATYRRAADGGVTFAANYAVLAPGEVALGDSVTVRSWLPEGDRGKAVRPS